MLFIFQEVSQTERVIDYAYFSLSVMHITEGRLTCAPTSYTYINNFKFLLKVVKPVEVVSMHNESRDILIKLCKMEPYQPIISYVTSTSCKVNSVEDLLKAYLKNMFLDDLLTQATYTKT